MLPEFEINHISEICQQGMGDAGNGTKVKIVEEEYNFAPLRRHLLPIKKSPLPTESTEISFHG